MSNSKSAGKRYRQSESRRVRNKSTKTYVRNYISKLRTSIANNSADVAETFKETISALDRAVSKGVIHKNTASRKKSRLAKALGKVLANVGNKGE